MTFFKIFFFTTVLVLLINLIYEIYNIILYIIEYINDRNKYNNIKD